MRIKYPRTYHLPWSQGATDDDKTHSPSDLIEMFEGKDVVVTEKMDGENTTIYSDGYLHARSLDSAHHPSRAWVKSNVAPALIGNLPDGWRVCGENLYAKHSLGYDRLPNYFMTFAIYDADNRCLSWDETVEWCGILNLATVPVLYRGKWNEALIKESYTGKSLCGIESEGYVVRTSDGFAYDGFLGHVAKFVRANHVTSTVHWAHSAVIPNKMS